MVSEGVLFDPLNQGTADNGSFFGTSSHGGRTDRPADPPLRAVFFAEIGPILRINGNAKLHQIGVTRNFGWQLVCGPAESGPGVGRIHDEGVIPLAASTVSDRHLKAHAPNLPTPRLRTYPPS